MKIHSDTAEKVFGGVRFSVYQWQQQVFDGSYRTYETAKRNDTVVIVALDGKDVVVIKEIQPHWDTEIQTVPCGVIAESEDIYNAAKRELREETGYVCKDWFLMDAHTQVPGVEWVWYFFIAKNVECILEKKLDSVEEKNSVFRKSIPEFIQMIRNDELHYPLPFLEKALLKYGDEKAIDILEHPEKYVYTE